MTNMMVFDTHEEMQAYLDKAVEDGLEAAEHHHVKVNDLKHGDHWVSIRSDYDGLAIFGEVIETASEGFDLTEEEAEEERQGIRNSRMKGFIFGKAFSVMCDEGEFGSTHITHINAKISKKLFELARSKSWTFPLVDDASESDSD